MKISFLLGFHKALQHLFLLKSLCIICLEFSYPLYENQKLKLPCKLWNSLKGILQFLSAVDWSLANFVAIRQNSIGQIRYVMKDLLKYLPFFGPYFMQVCNVFFHFLHYSFSMLTVLYYNVLFSSFTISSRQNIYICCW